MDIAAGLIKLKPNASAQVANWQQTLEARRDEAIQTLTDEGVEVESWFEVEIDGQPYLLWYMRTESRAKSREVFNKSTHDIDQFHAEIMVSITDAMFTATPLLDLVRK
jgi:hypothetical protein